MGIPFWGWGIPRLGDRDPGLGTHGMGDSLQDGGDPQDMGPPRTGTCVGPEHPPRSLCRGTRLSPAPAGAAPCHPPGGNRDRGTVPSATVTPNCPSGWGQHHCTGGASPRCPLVQGTGGATGRVGETEARAVGTVGARDQELQTRDRDWDWGQGVGFETKKLRI